MSPRIQGGRPGPDSFVFRVLVPSTMSPSEVAAVGDALGPYVWFDDTDGGLLCWVEPSDIEAAFPVGGFQGWWDALVAELAGLGADVLEGFGD